MNLRKRQIQLGTGAIAAAALAAGVWQALPARSDDGPALLVVTRGENALEIIDLATSKSRAKVQVGSGPHEVLAAADGKTAYVANYGGAMPGNTLSVIDVAQGKETKRVDLGALRRPHGLVEVDGKIYFTAEGAAAVGRYDPASGAVDLIRGTGQILTHSLALTPDGEKLYTANIGSASVSVLERTLTPQGAKTSQISVKAEPEGIAASPDAREVWIGHRTGGLSVIDTATDRVAATIDLPVAVLRLAFTPDGKHVLAGNVNGTDVIVLDVATRKEVSRIAVGQAPGTIHIAPDGKRAYVTVIADEQIAVIDLETLKLAGKIDCGPEPDGVAVAAPRPASTRMFKRRGMLGLAAAPVPADIRQAKKLEANTGLLVSVVIPDSGAQASGIRPEDILLTVDGAPVNDAASFVASVNKRFAGETLALEVLRGDQKMVLKATLKARPRE